MKITRIRILSILTAMLLLCPCILSVNAAIYIPDPYEDIVVDYICEKFDAAPEDVLCYRNSHIPSGIDASETVPDFLIYYSELNYKHDGVNTYGIYGNGYINNVSYGEKGDLGHLVYFPATGEIITLRDAWDRDVDGLREYISGRGVIIGDNDNDGVITVKDATIVQKCLAGLRDAEYFKVYAVCEEGSDAISHFCDFNRDGALDVRDATAIQKFAAGITA